MKPILAICLIALLLHTPIARAQMTVTHIAQGCAANHTLFLTSDGVLWCMGDNAYGDLGNGTYYPAYAPEESVASGVTSAAVGEDHSLLLKSDGSLWVMGGNPWGQLGDGPLPDGIFSYSTNQPEEIVPGGVMAIAAGYGHSLFIKSDGSLWAMGSDESGELGDGSFTPYPPNGIDQPEEIVPGGVTAIAAGKFFSLFLRSDGSLWAIGSDAYGQLGDGSAYFGTNLPEEIMTSDVTAIAAGYGHSLFLKSDGSLWAMGLNGYGELGNGTYNSVFLPQEIVSSNVTAIAAGAYFSLFLKSDGSLWGMGDNTYGQLGVGDWMNPSTNTPEEIIASNVTAIAAGEDHTLFLKSDGTLWGMGDNLDGQLGDGFMDNDLDPGAYAPEQIYPPPQPTLAEDISLTTNLQFTATCLFGGNYYLLASTNAAQPLSQWTPVWTNTVMVRYDNIFTATLTNAVNGGSQQFYMLQSR